MIQNIFTLHLWKNRVVQARRIPCPPSHNTYHVHYTNLANSWCRLQSIFHVLITYEWDGWRRFHAQVCYTNRLIRRFSVKPTGDPLACDTNDQHPIHIYSPFMKKSMVKCHVDVFKRRGWRPYAPHLTNYPYIPSPGAKPTPLRIHELSWTRYRQIKTSKVLTLAVAIAYSYCTRTRNVIRWVEPGQNVPLWEHKRSSDCTVWSANCTIYRALSRGCQRRCIQHEANFMERYIYDDKPMLQYVWQPSTTDGRTSKAESRCEDHQNLIVVDAYLWWCLL